MIRIEGLTKFYQMGSSVVHALDGVDLNVAAGEFVSITGASGSGKSTMMHLIGCLDRPTAGRYQLAGQRVDSLRDSRLAQIRNKYIGFVFQTFNLINRTSALDNVAVPLIYARSSGAKAKARKALERVGLAERSSHKPNELSGGERQRVAIARALVNEPPLLLADEPTGNLDSRTGEQIMDLFHELHASGVTIVLVTHEMAVAAQADRVVQMRDGKVLLDRKVDDAFRAELLASGHSINRLGLRKGPGGAGK
jgi:putative ABC transport system ATP-binding protein